MQEQGICYLYRTKLESYIHLYKNMGHEQDAQGVLSSAKILSCEEREKRIKAFEAEQKIMY